MIPEELETQFFPEVVSEVVDLTDSQKIDAMYQDIAAMRAMLADALTQVGPFLDKMKGSPVLGMLGIRL